MKILKSKAFYIFIGILFFITYRFTTNVDPNATIMFSIGKAWHNSPIIVARMLNMLSIIGTLFSLVLVARSVVKDFDSKIHHFFFTINMSKADYLGGRFFAGLSANILVYIGAILAFIIGCQMIDSKFSGPFSLGTYITPMILLVIPNLLFIGSVFFCFATLSRKMVLTYVVGVLLMLVMGMTTSFLNDLNNESIWPLLFDPFGTVALGKVYEFWTVADMNNNQLPYSGLLLLNRLIWLGFSILILFITVKKFKFSASLERKKKNKLAALIDDSVVNTVTVLEKIPYSITDKSFLFEIQKCFHLVKREFKRIVFHPAFIVLSFMGVMQIYNNFTDNVGANGSNIYALTSWYLRFADMGFGFIMPLTILFGGMIVWRERDHNSQAFYDTLPTPDWMSYLSKLFAMFGVQLFFVMLVLITGVLAQALVFNYYNFELDLYFARLFGIDLLSYWYIAVIVILIQNLASNKYLGFFLSAAFFLTDNILFDSLGYGNELVRYGAVPSYPYSNINGFGHYAPLLILYRIYWSVFAIILAVITDLLWRRDNETRLSIRWKKAVQRFNLKYKMILGALILVFFFSGGFIFYNNNVLNDYMDSEDVIASRANYEKMFIKYKDLPKPEVKDMNFKVDIYPDKRSLFIEGKYQLKNETKEPISKIVVNLSDRRITKINRLKFSIKAKVKDMGGMFGFKVYSLESPLMPSGKMNLDFEFEVKTPGFSDNNPKDEILENGTFLRYSDRSVPSFFPVIGYNTTYTIRDKYLRKEHGLEDKNVIIELEDTLNTTLLSGFVNYSAILSTSSDQTAVTNGSLVNQWQENGRNYFEYKSDTLISKELVMLSGKYELEEEKYKGINIKIYYDKKHPYNINRMKKGIKRAFDYGNKYFSQYPHNDVKIVEVANVGLSDGATASSQPTIFTWREDGGFISNLENAESRDVVFNTTTHEMAHQWWGNTIIPDGREGTGVLIETLAQWVRVMCMEKEYGKRKTMDFRRDEMVSYLRRRSRDINEEVPLKKAAFQNYLIYRKGTVVMYALQNYIGEEAVNAALRKITEKYSLQTKNSPTTIDLINEFRKVTPDSLQNVITDLFEKIILYDNKTSFASFEKLENGKYNVRMEVEVKKFESDGSGNENQIKINDYIEIGIFGENDQELYLKKHKLTENKSTLEFIIDQKPWKAGIDPYKILIDRTLSDNVIDVTKN